MDLTQLAQVVTAFLAPFLPYLLKAGEKAAEEAGKKLGGDAWERAKMLWGKLRPKVEAKPAAQEAVKDVAGAPQDEDAQAALRLQLKKLLTEDQGFAEAVAQLWAETEASGITIAAIGERSVAAQQIQGSIVVTGNQDVVQHGKYNVNVGEVKGLAVGDGAQTEVHPETEDKG